MPTIAVPAKVNLFLEVLGKRPDGFHDLESVFLAVDLADSLAAEPAPPGVIRLSCADPDVPTGDDNLIVRAARILRRECPDANGRGIHFHLVKRIPMGSGLGGGSSDAAAALRLADALWRTGLAPGRLAELGAELGSDVPFFLHGGVCLCEGRGERVTPLPAFPRGPSLGLVLSGVHSDTAAAYRGLRLPEPGARRDVRAFIRAMATGDAEAMAAAAFNRFEESVYAALPELDRLRRWLENRLAVPVRMTGSGSGLWFFAPPAFDAGAMQKALADEGWGGRVMVRVARPAETV